MTTTSPAVVHARAGKIRRTVPLGLAAGMGLVGSALVLVGVANRASPFALKWPGAWFFGTSGTAASSTSASSAGFYSVLGVYLGTGLLLAAWFEVVHTLRRRPDLKMGRLVAIFAAWGAPVVVMPPIFSHDVYVYAAEGQMVGRGINPYLHGPQSLGAGPFLALVDPIWKHSIASYGPFWERLASWVTTLAGHDVLASIVGFRCVALLGVIMIAWGVPELARLSGRSAPLSFALAVLNPLTLLILLGSAHNDALMVGLLVLGLVAARRGHLIAGLALCALAAQIKVPAILGAVYIAWWWSTSTPGWRARSGRLLAAGVLTAGWIVAIAAAAQLGWHWLRGLSNPGVVVSWLDPSTAAGLILGHLAGAVGFSGHNGGFITAARAGGICAAAVLSVVLLLRSNRSGPYFALGWSLLAFALLGPDIWPWYETWGLVVLAVAADHWTLRILLVLSAEACFTDFPSGQLLRDPRPVLTIVAWTALIGAAALYALVRLVPRRRQADARDQIAQRA